MRKLIFILMSFLLLSCGAAKNLPPVSPSVRDSVKIVTRIEAVLSQDHQKVPVAKQAVSKKTKEATSHLETDFAVSDASIDSTGTLHHTLSNKAGDVPVPTKTPVHSKDSIVYRDRKVEVPKPYPVEIKVPRELAWWQKALMWTGVVAMLAIAAVIIARLKKILL